MRDGCFERRLEPVSCGPTMWLGIDRLRGPCQSKSLRSLSELAAGLGLVNDRATGIALNVKLGIFREPTSGRCNELSQRRPTKHLLHELLPNLRVDTAVGPPNVMDSSLGRLHLFYSSFMSFGHSCQTSIFSG